MLNAQTNIRNDFGFELERQHILLQSFLLGKITRAETFKNLYLFKEIYCIIKECAMKISRNT